MNQTSIGLDIGAKAPISSSFKKVYYVLRVGASARHYFNPNIAGFSQYTQPLTGATRYGSVTEVLNAIQAELVRCRENDARQGFPQVKGLSSNFHIVRVEETPGSEQRVVLGETQEAPKGAVVQYAIKSCGEFAIDLTKPLYTDGRWTRQLSDARLHPSQLAAMMTPDTFGYLILG